MVNLVFPLSCLGFLGAATIFGDTVTPKQQTEKAAIHSYAAEDTSVWMIENQKSSAACLIYKNRKISQTKTQLDVDPACESVFSGAEFADVWETTENGHIVIGNSSGHVLARFARRSSGRFISVESTADPLTLTPNE